LNLRRYKRCHRDGTLKQAVAADPAKFIHRDDVLVPMLRQLKAGAHTRPLLTST
jgi:hypothetical protein